MTMQTERQRLEAKVAYLQKQLDDLKDYYYIPETYQLLISELDSQQVLLKRLEMQEQFAMIDADTPVPATPFVRS
jgi:hypothetical protein